ncbi:PAS domain S-box protein [Myxococcota bacterium]|nr:PAS domain S-box protein [Myxococcota bacterium]
MGPAVEHGDDIHRAQLAAVLDVMADGVVVFDMSGNVVLLNEAEARINGFASAAEMTRDLAFFAGIYELHTIDGALVPVDEWPVSRVLLGETLTELRLRARRLDTGQTWLIQFSGAPVRDAAGAQVLAVVITRDVTAEERARDALRASEERYRTFFESIDDGFCLIEVIFDADGQARDYRFLEANPAFARHSGLVDAVGRTARELVPDLDASWFEIYGDVAKTGRPRRFENNAPAMERWFDVYASRVGAPELGHVALVFRDVTERRRAEAALRDSQARAVEAAAQAEGERRLLDAVLEAAPVGIIVAGKSGEILRMNPANERLWGPAPFSEDVEGYDVWKGWWADGSDRNGQRIAAQDWAMARALRGEKCEDLVEIEPFDAPGTRRTMLNSGAPVKSASGRIVGAVIAQMDITTLMEAKAALRESEARFRALADNMSQLAWMADERGDIFWYNQRWFEYTGRPLEEMKGWGWRDVHHPDHVARVVEKFSRHVESGDPWEDTFPLRSRDGHYRWFLSRAVPIRDDRGRVTRWFGTNTDITAQIEAEEALRAAVAHRDEFLSVAAHELRTPLTALSLQLEGIRRILAKEVEPAGGRATARLDTAIRQSDRLGALIESLLNVSRIAAGHFRLEAERFDLGALVHEVVERVADLAVRAGCALRFERSGDLEGTWDRSRLDQVVMNLLTNAIKYGPGKPIEVSVAGREATVEIVVHDRGIGLSDADRVRIFDRFERAVSSTHYGGLGLGLYIAREIVHAHGGTVDVESALGEGATFVVRLPRRDAAPHERR